MEEHICEGTKQAMGPTDAQGLSTQCTTALGHAPHCTHARVLGCGTSATRTVLFSCKQIGICTTEANMVTTAHCQLLLFAIAFVDMRLYHHIRLKLA